MASPAYHAYAVTKRKPKPNGDNHDFWLAIGEATPHADGKGFSLKLQSLPLDGKIVLRPYAKSQEDQKKVIREAKAHKKEAKVPKK